MTTSKRITQLTSVHPRDDQRIFSKYCLSLSENGYDVTLCVADGKGNERKEGVSLLDVGTTEYGGRISRMTVIVRRIYKTALALNADLYHLHDPELIPVGLRLLRRNKVVIYDAHEDLPRQTLGKDYLNPIIRPALARLLEKIENFGAHRFSAITAATPHIRARFRELNPNVINVNNYPKLEEFSASTSDQSIRKRQVCYIGGITPNRGTMELIKAMNLIDGNLILAGRIHPQSFYNILSQTPGWTKVNYLGFVESSKVRKILLSSRVGVVTIYPLINYLDSLSVKMFEYMAAGLPVVASDFPSWRKIVEGNGCGICVDPMDPSLIARAIQQILDNPTQAQRMGKNGQKAVREKYNWDKESVKLLEVYGELFHD